VTQGKKVPKKYKDYPTIFGTSLPCVGKVNTF